MTKYALRFRQLDRMRTQVEYRNAIATDGLDAKLAPYMRPARVPGQRRGNVGGQA